MMLIFLIIGYILIGGFIGYIFYLLDVGVTHHTYLKDDIYGPVFAGIFWPITGIALIGVFAAKRVFRYIKLEKLK